MHRIAQTLYSQKTLHTSPLRASYGVSFVSILAKNNRVMKGSYCNSVLLLVIEMFLFRVQAHLRCVHWQEGENCLADD